MMANYYFCSFLLTLAQISIFFTHCYSGTYQQPTAAELIAYQIKTNLHHTDTKYLDAIIEGIEASSNNVNLSEEENQAFLFSVNHERHWSAQQNLIASEKWMLERMNEKNISIIVPSELLYRVVKEGNGQTLTSAAARVRINHLILKFDDLFPESSEKNQTYELSHLIPGLAKGMHAMKEGEIRKIYIHPKHAYGNSHYFEPHCALEVTVELLNILPSEIDTASAAASLEAGPTPRHPLISREALEEVLTKKYYVLGWRLWNHLKFGYTLFNKEELIRSMREQKMPFEHSSEIERDVNRVHWLIYQQRIQDQQSPQLQVP
jgi:FKBP-type peptidyl-prolyl cis-trans isomerase